MLHDAKFVGLSSGGIVNTIMKSYAVYALRYPELSEPLEMFDSDDLDENRVFVLFVPETTTAHVWVGTQSAERRGSS